MFYILKTSKSTSNHLIYLPPTINPQQQTTEKKRVSIHMSRLTYVWLVTISTALFLLLLFFCSFIQVCYIKCIYAKRNKFKKKNWRHRSGKLVKLFPLQKSFLFLSNEIKSFSLHFQFKNKLVEGIFKFH